MPLKDIPEPWRSFLVELDNAAQDSVDLHCMGGFVVTQLYGLPRPTSDIDALLIAPREQREVILAAGLRDGRLHRKHGVYLDYVTIAAFPYEYEERLIAMFPGAFQKLHLFALDPYDLALTKLERNIQRDRDDVRFLAERHPFDLAELRRRYHEELRPYLGNPKREDLTLDLWVEAIEEDRTTK
jgi:hypothetical protein